MNKQSNYIVSSKGNLIACTLNVLTALKTIWSMSQMLTAKVLALTPRQSNAFLLWVFRLATGKRNYNSFFHNDNSLIYINYCEATEATCSSWLCILSQGQGRITIFHEKYLALCLLPLDWNNIEIHLLARIFLAVRSRKCALCYCSDAHFWILGFLSCFVCSPFWSFPHPFT